MNKIHPLELQELTILGKKIDEAALEYIEGTESKKTKHLLERNTTETFIGWCCPSCRFTYG